MPTEPAISTDVTTTVKAEVARDLIGRAGLELGEGGWLLRDGGQTRDPRDALTDALLVLAEKFEIPMADVIDAAELEAAQNDPRVRSFHNEADAYLEELERQGRNR